MTDDDDLDWQIPNNPAEPRPVGLGQRELIRRVAETVDESQEKTGLIIAEYFAALEDAATSRSKDGVAKKYVEYRKIEAPKRRAIEVVYRLDGTEAVDPPERAQPQIVFVRIASDGAVSRDAPVGKLKRLVRGRSKRRRSSL